MSPWHWPQIWTGKCALAIEMWSEHDMHLPLFEMDSLNITAWFGLTSLSHHHLSVRMNIINRGYSISLRLWMIRYWAAEPRWTHWVKQSWSWSTALIQCEPEINLCCCKLLRLRDCLSPGETENTDIHDPSLWGRSLLCSRIHFPFVLILPKRLPSGIYSFFKHHSNGLGESMHKFQLHEVWILVALSILTWSEVGTCPSSAMVCLLTFTDWHAYCWGKLSLHLSLDSC